MSLPQTPKLWYESARGLIRDGDVLIFLAGRDISSCLIGAAGRSDAVHAGMAAWWNGRLMCVHTLQWRGGRVDLLGRLLPAWESGILVRRPTAPSYCPLAAVDQMQEIIGHPYGWGSIFRASVAHMPILRLLLWRKMLPFMLDDGGNGNFPFCSMAVSRAMRAGGVDPVEHLSDAWTEPADLARSEAMADLCLIQGGCDE